MHITIQPMTLREYDDVYALWQRSPGIGLSDADSRENVARFLERNPGLSMVARAGPVLVGAVLCGHDGRRGYLHHLAVSDDYRRRGIARSLVARSLSALERQGIAKAHVFVYSDNRDGIAFWKRVGWAERDELTVMSRLLGNDGS